VTSTYLPKIEASVGDLEFGDVEGGGDRDVVLANWGPGSPMANDGGRTILWLNDGKGHFTDVTEERMPADLVRFSWGLEFVDGEYLWSAAIGKAPAGNFDYEVCAKDAVGNGACASPHP
jgi:hypothetical protein